MSIQCAAPQLLVVVLLVWMVPHIPPTDCNEIQPRNRLLQSSESRGDPASYWVTFSTRVRPGVKLPVTVRLAKDDVTSTVSVSLRNASDETIVFSETSETVKSDDGSKIIYLDIPDHLRAPSGYHFRYTVRVMAEGDLTFNQSKTVRMDRKFFSIFVQTDKAKYKPGQTVKFRVLAMNPDLTIRHDPMDIFVRDPTGNAMKLWRGATGYQKTGVVERTIPTSSHAPQGDWQIAVTMSGYSETKKFTIAEYVLPKFEATLELPEKVILSENYVAGKACAKYTFGKPLTKADVVVTLKTTYFYDRYKNRTQPTVQKVGKVNKKGEFHFKVYKSEMLQLVYDTDRNRNVNVTERLLRHREFLVIVNVTDARSGKKMGTASHLHYLHNPAEIEFTPTTPDTYKPGLRYTAQVKVRQYDGSLFQNYKDIKVDFNVTFTISLPDNTTTTTTTPAPSAADPEDGKNAKRRPHPGGIVGEPMYQPKTYQKWIAVTKQLTENGYLALDVDVPENTTNLLLTASLMGSTTRRFASKADSPSGNFLQLQAQEDNPKAGHKTTVMVKTTEPVPKLIYQLYAKGMLMDEAEGEAVDNKRQKFILTFKVTANMAPICRVLAFYFRSDGEVVADSLSLNLNTSAQPRMSLSYSKAKVQPGEGVEMEVGTLPNSTVFLLAIDKSVKLLKSGNGITQDMVNKELMQYGWGGNFHIFWPLLRVCGWPFPSPARDAAGVFSDANVAILTDGVVYQNTRAGGGMVTFGMGTRGTGNRAVVPTSAKGAKKDDDDAPDRVRKFFPETWLFDAVFIGKDGKLVMSKTAPDTITTWLTTAFAVHPTHGLSVLPKAAELTTFRKMFVSVDLPYSAVRGEDLCLKAYAHNYYDRALSMRLTMQLSHGISNIRVVRTMTSDGRRVLKEYVQPLRVSHRLGRVFPNEIAETTFCFMPNALGHHPIRINLTSPRMPGDGIERTLLVEAGGVPRTQAESVILDMSKKRVFEQQVPVQFPKTTIHGSHRITVAVAADLLGPVFDNIEDLLRMPYGCGEQNMLYFAPNVFLIDYLQNTNTYTPQLAKKAEHYMMVGYQKELKYKHKDGSYSAFGERPNRTDVGSMWLTAFVTKCFVQSMALEGDVISVEPKLVHQSVSWMLAHQLKNGSFPEPGKVFNKNMQGGSGKGEALTAYVLIALAEANQTAFKKNMTNDHTKMITDAMLRSRKYLEKAFSSLDDPYDLAIVTYALHLTDSEKAERAFEMLEKTAHKGPLTTHWERSAPKKQKHYYWQRRTDAINIEMTAYALLTYLHRKDITGATPIVRWLTQQRGPQGGFISTQDTVIALQGLAQVATKLYQPTFTPINVSVHWAAASAGGKHQHRTVVLNDTSKLLLHKIDVPVADAPENLTIRATALGAGNFGGIAVAEVILHYNINQTLPEAADTGPGTFNLTAEVQMAADVSSPVVLKLRAHRADGHNSSMTVVEVKVPSGYMVDEDSSSWDITGTKMAEAEAEKSSYVLYYEKMSQTVMMASLPLTSSGPSRPINTEPCSIRIYDYYETSKEAVISYDVDGKNDHRGVCKVDSTYEGCRLLKMKQL